MSKDCLLVANRGEIAVRILKSALDLGLSCRVIYSDSDADASHVLQSQDQALKIPGDGPAAYLDIDSILAVAKDNNCTQIHPGYGFLSESAEFAQEVERVGLTWVGPTPDQLRLFGNKLEARAQAVRCGIPVLPSSDVLENSKELDAYIGKFPADTNFVLKAVYGGGGRGIRLVNSTKDTESLFNQVRQEAFLSFSSKEIYVEEFSDSVRHIEVQVVGDGAGRVEHLGERDCSLQRRHQKILELAPAPLLTESTRTQLWECAVRLAAAVKYQGVGTVEFLVNSDNGNFYFIEMNPRLQVEHTVTEMLYGIDLVQVQLRIAAGEDFEVVLKNRNLKPSGCAMQLRINAEKLSESGEFYPATGRILEFQPPAGIGFRVDAGVHEGVEVTSHFDPLIAKLIVYTSENDLSALIRRAKRGLSEFRLSGVQTNIEFLKAIISEEAIMKVKYTTKFVDDFLLASSGLLKKVIDTEDTRSIISTSVSKGELVSMEAPLRGNVIKIECDAGQTIVKGQVLLLIDAMKMHHELKAPISGVINRINVREGDVIDEGFLIAVLEANGLELFPEDEEESSNLSEIRSDLQEVFDRHSLLLDENRNEAVLKRRKNNSRTARENVAHLCDDGSFVEYGALTIAAQRRRRSVEDLQVATPADGMIAGFGTINCEHFDKENSRCAVLAYDYTVLAGTQGHNNHKKKDRIFELAGEREIPVVFFTEGGGGRPGDVDTDDLIMSWLDIKTFATWPQLSGVAPRIAINSGRCFAGNAVIFGCADVTIATKNSNIGLAGPAMIEGGGLGSFKPEDIGPAHIQTKNGVIDLLCEDESDATENARRLLAYFQGRLKDYEASDQRLLRHLIPEDRLRVYDIRRVIETLADKDSVIELRRQYGVGLVTALVRLEGRPFGLIANDPNHLGGAIDAEGGEKGGRFLQLCDCFDLPVISLCDTPGFMVGPKSEETASVRRGSRLITASANLSVPLFTVVLRKGYGLGAQAMAGGSFHQPFFTIAWPTSEMGPMGLEGAVELGFRRELDLAKGDRERKSIFDELLKGMYMKGKGVSVASSFEVDAVIDPRETREWLLKGLNSSGQLRKEKHPRRYPDVW